MPSHASPWFRPNGELLYGERQDKAAASATDGDRRGDPCAGPAWIGCSWAGPHFAAGQLVMLVNMPVW